MDNEIKYEERSSFYEHELVDTVDIAFIKLLIEKSTCKIMEIPCGAGRVAFEIANTKHHVTAADIEPAMIEQLKQRLIKHPLSKYIKPIVADMCEFNFDDCFDLIIVPREAFQLINKYRDAVRALKNIKKHLNINGKIMIDLFPFGQKISPLKNIELRPDYYNFDIKDEVIVEDWSKEIDENTILTRLHEQNHTNPDYTEVTYHFRKTNKSNGIILSDQIMKIELMNYSVELFKKACVEANVKIEAIYGDYESKCYEDGDPRMIFLLH